MKRMVLAATVALSVAAISVSSIQAAKAADIGNRGYYGTKTYAAPFSWTGFYVGGTVGYGRANATASSDLGGLATFDSSTSGSGVVGGATVGYNYQMGNIVFGLEGDLNVASLKGNSSQDILVGGILPVNVAVQGSLDWFGTVRGRLGYNLNGWMPYATGGFAYGGVSASCQASVFGFQVASCSEHKTLGGFAYGAGLEYAVNRNWSAKLEYLHLDFRSFDVNVSSIAGDTTASIKPKADIVRVGLNYRF